MSRAWIRALARRWSQPIAPIRRQPKLQFETLEERVVPTLNTPPIHFLPTPATPFAVESPDLNGDGRPDIAILGKDGTLSIGLNNGANGWTSVTHMSLGRSDVVGLTFGAVDVDPFVDAVLQVSDGLYVGLGDGQGRLTGWQSILLGASAGPNGLRVDPVVANLDADPFADIMAVVPGMNEIVVLRGNGTRRLGDPIRYASGGIAPVSILAGAFIGDATTDVVVGHRDGTLTFFQGNSDGGLTLRPELTVSGLGAITSLASADIDGDGELDLVVAAENQVNWLRNRPDPAPGDVLVNGEFNQGLTGWEDVRGRVTAGGKYAEFREDATGLLSTIRQTFTVPQGAQELNFDLTAYGIEDALGGLPDLFEASLLNAAGQPLVIPFRSDASAFASFQPGKAVGLGNGVTFDGRRVAVDLSGLPVGTQATIVLHLAGHPSGNSSVVGIDNVAVSVVSKFDDGFDVLPLPGPFVSVSGVTVGDVDGDGHVDIVVADQPSLVVLNGNGQGGFVRDDYPLSKLGDVTIASLTTGDSIGDVVVIDPSGAWSPLVTTNDPPFDQAPRIGLLAPLTSIEGTAIPFSVGFADVDASGPYTASIEWGDGSTSEATVSFDGVSGSIIFNHTYADNGSYTIRVTLRSASNGPVDFQETTATITNAAPVLNVHNITVDAGVFAEWSLGSFTDLGFTLPDFASRETFLATIDWGDGSSTPFARIDLTNGSAGTATFGSLFGSHRFAQPGVYSATVTVRDDDGGETTQSFKVTVRPPVANDGVWWVPGTPGDAVRVQVDLTCVSTDFDNELGYYIVEDAQGRVNGLLPSDAGYAQAVLASSNRGILFARGYQTGASVWLDLTAGQYVAFYLVQNDTTANLLANNPTGGLTGTPHVFFSVAGANADDRFAHFLRSDQADGWVDYTTEDMDFGGDNDFNDTCFSIRPVDSNAAIQQAKVTPASEGSESNLSVTVGHAIPGTSVTLAVDWGDGTSSMQNVVITGNDVSVNVPHTYADNGSYDIALSVSDDSGVSVARQRQAIIDNVAPTLTVGNPTVVEEGTLFAWPATTFSDPGFTLASAGTSETFTATIDWGDGSTLENVPVNAMPGTVGTATTGTITASHTFATAGSYAATLRLRDDDAGEATQTITIVVEASQTQPGLGCFTMDTPHVTGVSRAHTITTTGAVTNDGSIVLEGTASPGATLSIARDQQFVGTTVASGDGSWRFDGTNTQLSAGTYNFTVTQGEYGPLGEAAGFNGFILGDAIGTPDVKGRFAVGGNVQLQNFSVAQGVAGSNAQRDHLVVGGNLTLQGGQVYGGNATYGGLRNVSSNTTLQQGAVRKESIIDFAAARTYLEGRADAWAALPSNGTTSYLPTDSRWAITLTATEPGLNVFTVDGSKLTNASSVTVHAPSTATVLVNVTGTSGTMQNFGFQLQNGITNKNIIWNFQNYTSLTLNSIGVQGSVFAPRAAAHFNNGNIDGQLVASSWHGTGVLRNATLDHSCAPTGTAAYTVTVDAPANEASPKFFVVGGGLNSRLNDAGSLLGSSSLVTSGTTTGIAANADGTITWTVAAQSNGTTIVTTMDTDGSIRGQWRAWGVTDARDITVKDNTIWIVGRDASTNALRIFRFDKGAIVRSGGLEADHSFALRSNNTNPTGLVSDGWNIYVVDGSAKVFAYDKNGQTLGNTQYNPWQLDLANSNPTGVTLNPSGGNELWVVDKTANRVFRYNNGRGNHWWNNGGPQTASSTFNLPSGVTNIEGIADPLPAGWNPVTPAPTQPHIPAPVDFTSLNDITPLAALTYATGTYNWAEGEYRVDTQLNNINGPILNQPVVAQFNQLTPGVTLTNSDGTVPTGESYITWDSELLQEGLATDQASTAVTLSFATDRRYNFEVALLSPENRPPIFNPISDEAAPWNEPFTLIAVANDPDGDPLVYSLIEGPSGMSIDPTTGRIDWAPTVADSGSHAVTVRVEDGRSGSDTASFVLNVTEPVPSNRAPIIVSTPRTAFTLGSGDGSTSGPATITLDAVVRDFSSSHPDFEQGRIGFATGMVENQLGLDGNPVFAGPNGHGYVNSAATFNQWYNDVPGVNQTTILPLTLTESSAGSGIYQIGSGAFFPIDGQLGGNENRVHNYHFTLRMETTFTYRGGETFNFTGDDDIWVFIDNRLAVDIGGIHGPVSRGVNLDSFGLSIGQQYSFVLFFAERQTSGSNFFIQTSIDLVASRAYQYQTQAIDADNDPLTYSLLESPTGMTIDPTTGLVQWVPSSNQSGDHLVRIQVSDGQGGEDTQEFTLSVTPPGPNESPKFTSIPPTRILPGDTYQYKATAADPNDDPLTFNILSGPSGLLIDRLKGTLTWATTTADAGDYPVVLEVNDGRGGAATQSFTLRVTTAPNQAPAFTSTPLTVGLVGERYDYTATANDPDGDPLSYELVAGPEGMAIDSHTGRLVWLPVQAEAGTYNIVLRVRDGLGAEALQSYQLVIDGAWELAIRSTPPRLGTVGDPYQYTPLAVGRDGQPVLGTLSLIDPPAGMTIDATGRIDWIPSVVGMQRVTIRAEWYGQVGYQSYLINVRPINVAPTVTAPSDKELTAGTIYRGRATAVDSFDHFTLSLGSDAPAGLMIDPSTGVLTWQSYIADLGTHSITILATDDRGAVGQATFTLTVVPDITAPTLAIVTNGDRVNPGENVLVTMSVADDVGVVERTLTVDGISYPVDGNGQAIYTPTTPGIHVLVGTARDAAGNETTSLTRLRVLDPTDNSAPIITIDTPRRRGCPQLHHRCGRFHHR